MIGVSVLTKGHERPWYVIIEFNFLTFSSCFVSAAVPVVRRMHYSNEGDDDLIMGDIEQGIHPPRSNSPVEPNEVTGNPHGFFYSRRTPLEAVGLFGFLVGGC